MTTGRVYRMTAAEGRGDELAAALGALIPVVLEQPGCTGIDLLRDTENPLRFLFIEKWDSIDAHKAALGALPPGTLTGVMGALGCPPEGTYEEYL